MITKKVIRNKATVSFAGEICDCGEIERRLDELEANQWDCDKTETCLKERLENIENNITIIKNDLIDIHNRVEYLEQFTMVAEVKHYMAPLPTTLPIRGIGVSVIRIGNTYNLWGTGTLTTTANIALIGGNKYYLLEAGQPDPPVDPINPVYNKMFELTWYQGDPTIGTLWIKDLSHSGGSEFYNVPLEFDKTGIYFTVPSGNINNLTPGTVFRFTQALILTEPIIPPSP